MKNVKTFINSAPVDKRLEFGYVKNIIISAIDTGLRKENGVASKKQIAITLSAIDTETGKIKASSVGSYWRLQHGDKFLNGYNRLISSLITISNALGCDEDAFYSHCLMSIPEEIENEADWLAGKLTAKDVEGLQEAIVDAVNVHMVPKIEEKRLLKCKILMNSKGFFELGTVENWILPMDSKEDILPISSMEQAQYDTYLANLNKKEKPDNVGKPPATGGTSSEKSVKKVSELDL